MATALELSPALHLFGIRHHGPGSARSLRRALDDLQADCVLIEGPPEAEPLLPLLRSPDLHPPVALLTHGSDEPGRARFHPFAVFSPEWQALQWATQHGVPVRFIDLPVAIGLALEQAEQEKAAAEVQGDVPPPPEAPAETATETATQAPADPATEADADLSDPLDWLARAAGHADGEAWWNFMVEEHQAPSTATAAAAAHDGQALFAAIDLALCTLRAELPAPPRSALRNRLELLREAQMRQQLREAVKQGFERIAVVVGAWHLGGLRSGLAERGGAKADAALLKGLPKLKVACTWVPWSYRHLTRASGYGAGIESPGWYEHLWDSSAPDGPPRTVGWMARVARLLRERDLDCSSAHLIEACRLADTLAALRQRPAPGLDELREATRCVLTLGDDTALRFIDDALIVGDRLGRVPPEVPAVPLQRDLERWQKTLRLKPEALDRTLDLDLRQPNDLARSQLLHRLGLLGLDWGRLRGSGNSRGTFHEVWTLQWQPAFALRLIEASIWGQTVEAAAGARALHRAEASANLPELSALVDQVLLADLPSALQAITTVLAQRAALSADVPQMLATLPDLARVFRYGNVRQTDTGQIAQVIDSLTLRAAIALPLACCALDDSAAAALRPTLLAAHGAVALRVGTPPPAAAATTAAESPTTADTDSLTPIRDAWQRALVQLARQDSSHALLQGLATRLLLDDGLWSADEVAQALGLHLSVGSDPGRAAAWLEGFLNGNATVLLHDARVWTLVDGWLMALPADHFTRVLPLVRRSFAQFSASERRDLGQRARQGQPATQTEAGTDTGWDTRRALLPLPLLQRLWGATPPSP